MRTLGIDLSSQPKNTAACLIEWTLDGARAEFPVERCDDATLDQLIARADAVGIDAPLGWPLTFKAAVAKWESSVWNNELRDDLCLRLTDRVISAEFGLNPLSVSTDRIALPAMRAMALLNRHGITDRSGDRRFCEVYPAASLKTWNLPSRGYKKAKTEESEQARRGIAASLRQAMPWLTFSDSYIETADALDALIASLSVRCAAGGTSLRPTAEQRPKAEQEGWIHVSRALPRLDPA